MHKALMGSEKKDWQTPDHIRSMVTAFGEGRVFDPCPGPCPVGTPGTGDGLAIDWPVCTVATVFVNPPYGNVVRHWVRKAANEAHGHSEVLMLLPARTDTVWFHDAMQSCQSVLLIKGRLTFRGAPHPAPFPSMILYWGQRQGEFEAAFCTIGYVLDTE